MSLGTGPQGFRGSALRAAVQALGVGSVPQPRCLKLRWTVQLLLCAQAACRSEWLFQIS